MACNQERRKSIVKRRYPIKPFINVFYSFPYTFQRSEEKFDYESSLKKGGTIQNNIQTQNFAIKHTQNERELYLNRLKILCFDKPTKYDFPVEENKMGEIFKPDIQITVSKDSSKQLNTGTILNPVMKFPLKEPLITNKLSEQRVNILQRFGILTSYMGPLPPKLAGNRYSDHINNMEHFPITKVINVQKSKEKGSDELFLHKKTDLATSACTIALRISDASFPRVIQSGNFVDENYYGEILLETNNETKTRLRNNVCTKYQQKEPTYRYIHSISDGVLATEAAKNISYLRRPKNGDEPSHIFIKTIKYSRSPLRIQCFGKNTNNLKKRQRHVCKRGKRASRRMKMIKMPHPRRVSQSRARKIEKIDDFVFNTERIRFNKLSDIHHKGQQEPWSTHFVHSEVCDSSLQEDLIVDGQFFCVPCQTRIRVQSLLYLIENLPIANLATSTPVSSNYRLTLLEYSVPTSKTIFILTKNNEYERSVDKYFFLTINSDVRTVLSIKDEEEKASTKLQRLLKTNVFNGNFAVAMPQTKIEEKEENNISVTSFKSDENSNLCFDERFLNEVKFEMNDTNIVPNTMTQSLNERIQFISSSKEADVAGGSGILCAAADISKLANFGKRRRELVTLPVSCCKVSNDVNNSVLPTRTLLRRQRSLKLQNTTDKQEDPIERLNRLRARISGALSEVKGVLKHYSIEEGIENAQISTDSFPNINLTNDSTARIEPNQITSSLETIRDEGPVSFRFVRKVRRQSVFSEGDVGEKKEAEDGKDKNEGETRSCVPSRDASMEKNYTDQVPLIQPDYNPKNCNQLNENIYSGFENQLLKIGNQATQITDRQNELNNGVEKKETELGESTNGGERNSCVPFQKDSKKENCMQKVSLIHADYKIKNCDQLKEDICFDFECQSSQTGYDAPQVTDLRENLNLHSTDVKLAHLATLKEEATPDGTHEVNNIIRCDTNDFHLSAKEITSKKKFNTKSIRATRRASIAVVEGSQIDPVINTVIPLAIKIQRRPSDSETIIKKKVKASEAANNSSTKKIVKVKRMPVKNKLDVLTKKLTASNSENNQCIISAKGSTSNNTISQAKTTKELSGIALPKTSDILSSQLTIAIEVNDAPLSSAQEPGDIKSEVTQLLSIATNNSRSSTEIVDANSVVVAVLASPLQAGKASSRTNNSENQPTNLFVDNGKIVEEQNLSHSKEIIEIKSTKSTDPQRDLSIKHNFEGVENSQLLECIVNDTTQLEAESINTDLVSTDLKGFEQQRALKAKQHYLPQLIDEKQIDEKMPELQVSPTPVKPVQAFAENSADKISISKKKTVVRRIARKVSVDKSLEKTKAEESQLEETAVGKENKENERLIIEDKQTGVVVNKASQNSTFCNEVSTEKESSPGASAIAPPLEKPRKVKKKVIIKRQHRKLSVGENSFFKEAEVVQGATETLEKAIAYVTDDEEDNKAQIAEVCHPIKSCMKSREFQVGDWVMYGERFRKTQIRWKKGQISERITSISYKIKIDDKEVSAHISYIKKYTGRKVNFGGKEYLEIDYEQLAEEERQARSYSIWNMV